MKNSSITDHFIQHTVDKVCRNKRVRRKIDGNGKISIDRKLPYILLYRYPLDKSDAGTVKLILSESSYLVAPRDTYDQVQLKKLLRSLTEAMVKEFGSFLILEIWSTEEAGNTFKIFGPGKGASSTIEALEKGLKDVKNFYPEADVEVISSGTRNAPKTEPVFSVQEIKELGCLVLGLEVPRIFQDLETGRLYPVFLRTFRSHLSKTLRKAIYDFVRVQTSFNVEHFHMLGRTSVDTAVWHIDKKLAEIEKSYQFLLLVSPINSQLAWKQFKKDKFETPPEFHYRLLPVDPELLKKKLYKLNIHKIDDPALAYLFRDKREELDKQITLLEERGTRNFLYTSIRLYKGVEEDLLKIAEGLLAAVPSDEPSGTKDIFTGSKSIKSFEFRDRALEEFKYYKKIFPGFNSKIEIRNDVPGLMVSHGNLLIPEKMKLDADRMNALIQHEVGTHVLTYNNGNAQPLQQLKYGLADYDELQEGLAVLSEYLVGGLTRDRMRLLAARVVCAHDLIDGADFIDAYRKLTGQYGFKKKTAFGVVTRTYQGGGFIKDVIYLRGLVRLISHIKNGGELEPLFIGKIAEKHIPIIKELRDRGILRNIPALPRYLTTEMANERLEHIKKGILLTDLIEKEVA